MSEPVKTIEGRAFEQKGKLRGDDFNIVITSCEGGEDRTLYVREGKLFLNDPAGTTSTDDVEVSSGCSNGY